LGAGRVAPFGLLLVLAGTLPLTHVGAHTSYLLVETALLVRGLELGATVAPTVAGAYRNLDATQLPAAAPTLNIGRQVGASFGSALFAVVLARFVNAELSPIVRGFRATDALASAAVHPQLSRTPLAAAFSSTFWVMLALTAVPLIPTLLLSRTPVSARSRASLSVPDSEPPAEPAPARAEVLESTPSRFPDKEPVRRRWTATHGWPTAADSTGAGRRSRKQLLVSM
jgi:hypothetical protein